MSHAPLTVTRTTRVTDLLALFERHDYNAIPVLGEQGRLEGIVSKLDILQAFLGPGARPRTLEERLSAADLMQRKVIALQAEDSIADAGNLMIMTKLRSIPVVEDRDAPSKLVGMLSRGDVLRGLRFELDRQGGRPPEE
jgi:CBS domain-containing protein